MDLYETVQMDFQTIQESRASLGTTELGHKVAFFNEGGPLLVAHAVGCLESQYVLSLMGLLDIPLATVHHDVDFTQPNGTKCSGLQSTALYASGELHSVNLPFTLEPFTWLPSEQRTFGPAEDPHDEYLTALRRASKEPSVLSQFARDVNVTGEEFLWKSLAFLGMVLGRIGFCEVVLVTPQTEAQAEMAASGVAPALMAEFDKVLGPVVDAVATLQRIKRGLR